MSNKITHPRYGWLGELRMSNGRTNVVLSVLALAGSLLAKTHKEKELILWIAEGDQSRRGMGTVGFDLSELPWSLEEKEFIEEKAFLLKAIEAAQKELGWERIGVRTKPDDLRGDLEQIRMLILNLTIEDFSCASATTRIVREDVSAENKEKNELINYGQDRCRKHEILLTKYGCIACNNLG